MVAPSHNRRQPETQDEALWRYDDVAAYLGKSVSTIRRWRYEGVLPFRRIGRGVRFFPDEIRRWAAKQPAA